jgi:hypothetical protein
MIALYSATLTAIMQYIRTLVSNETSRLCCGDRPAFEQDAQNDRLALNLGCSFFGRLCFLKDIVFYR